MMIIELTPTRSDDTMVLCVYEDVLVINAEEFDFSALPEGGTLPPEAVHSPFVVGPATREDGEIHIVLLLPHGPDAPEDRRFPKKLHIMEAGLVTLPDNEVSQHE